MTKFCNSNSSDKAEQISGGLLTKDSPSKSVSSMKKLPRDEKAKTTASEEKDFSCGADKLNTELSFSTSVEDKKDSSVVYYAVSVPSESLSSEKDGKRPLYFTNKQDALQEVKKHKGARFKTFHTEEEALAFSLQAAEQMFHTPKNNVQSSPSHVEHEKSLVLAGEKPSPFKGPKSQDMVKLRKAIEAGDISYFRETVWSNPRYLISSGDTPAILQEGFRYNALHVAAKHKQPEVCELLLKTIEDPKFMELLYSDDAPDIRMQRIAYVTDLYLNMPDKGLCESPLHFASKFGCLQAVQVLTSHPLCDKKRKNKYGLEPREIICERCPSSSAELKRKIEEAFEAQYFVPVLRAEDNSIQPFVGKPYCQDGDEDVIEEISDASPCKTKLTVMAVAGPMSPKEAELFYRFWKTPPSQFSRSRYQQLNKIRLSDTEKGLEILGRHLARNFNAPWTEYWPSLNAWCDLSSKEGLDVLENHLKMLHCILKLKTAVSSPPAENSVPSIIENDMSCASPSLREAPARYTHSTPTIASPSNSSSSSCSSSGMSALCSGLKKLHLNESNSYQFVTSPDMPSILSSNKSFSETGSSSLSESLANSPCSKGRETRMQTLKPTTAADPVNIIGTPRRNTLLKRSTLNIGSCSKAGNETSFKDIAMSTKPASNSRKKKWLVTDYDGCQSRVKLESCVQSDNLPPSFTVPIKNIVENVLSVFASIISDSDPAVDVGMHMHLLLAEDVLPKIDHLLKSPTASTMDLSIVHSSISFIILKELQENFTHHEIELVFRNARNYLDAYFSANVSENDDSFDRNYSRNAGHGNRLKWQHLRCILEFLLHKYTSGNFISEQKVCQCSWLTGNELKHQVHSLANELNLRFNFDDITNSHSMNDSDDDSSSDELESFVTPPGSPSEIYLSSDDDGDEDPVTPDEGFEVYIEGEWPSKADSDILRAIENVPVDPVLYPHICRWKHLVMLKDKEVVESWPSPANGRFRGKSFFRNPGALTPSPPQTSHLSVPRSVSTSRCRSNRNRITQNIKEARQLFDDFVACDESNRNS